jgi:hypothetical protein
MTWGQIAWVVGETVALIALVVYGARKQREHEKQGDWYF